MKNPNNNELIKKLYETHTKSIITRNNSKYLTLFQHYNDVVANVHDENLRNRIIYSHINIEELLFEHILHTSKTFYEFGFHDLKSILFKD